MTNKVRVVGMVTTETRFRLLQVAEKMHVSESAVVRMAVVGFLKSQGAAR